MYRDRTFCSAWCLNFSCDRNWTVEQDIYDRDEEAPPVSLADLSKDCADYIPPPEAA